MNLPPFPRRHPAPPETQEECDEAIAYWSAMSEMTGLPVEESDGSSTLDRLLELRASLANKNSHGEAPNVQDQATSEAK